MRHKLDYAMYQIRVWGLEFEVGNKYFAQAINRFPHPSDAPGPFTKIPMAS
jgi:hypothetical protein